MNRVALVRTLRNAVRLELELQPACGSWPSQPRARLSTMPSARCHLGVADALVGEAPGAPRLDLHGLERAARELLVQHAERKQSERAASAIAPSSGWNRKMINT